MEGEHYGHINATGDDRPSLKDLHDHVVQNVAHKWKDIGVQLLRPDQQEAVRIIELDHPRDTVECCKRVFEKWLDTTPDATWNRLISALRSPTVQLDYWAAQIGNMMVVEMEATTSSNSGQGTCSRFTTFDEMDVEFAIMTNKIKQALINNNVDVDSLIEQLCAVSAVSNKNVPLFDKNVFARIRSVDEFWKSLRTFWNIYDYDLLRLIVRIAKCGEAKKILEEFLSRIDPSTLEDVDLVIHCRVDEIEGLLMPTLRIKVNAEKCTNDVKQKVKKIVSKKFNLEEYALRFKGIKDGCIELLYHISEPVKSYLLQYKLDEGTLTEFSTYKIISLHVDDVDIFKWSIAPHLLGAMAPDNLKCPECREVFKQAKYLPCYHSYCEQCLEKIQVQSKITCPECRMEAIIPSGGVKDLDDNFIMNCLVDKFILKCKVESEADVKCDECSEVDPAVTFCLDCTIFLCHVCSEHHKRSNKFRGHRIVPLTELRSQRYTIQLKSKPLMCRDHNTELSFYCETCDQLVCIHCIVRNHIFHRHDVVKKMVGKHKEELKKVTAPIEEMIRGLSDTHGNIEKMMKKILHQGDEVNKKIDQHYNRVIQQLMAQKEQMKQQVYDKLSQKEKAVTTQLEEVEYAQAEVLSIKELNDAMEKSSDQEVLSVKKQVIDRMKNVTDKYNLYVYLPLAQPDIMKFVPTKNVLPQLGLVCSTASPDPHNCEIVDPPKYSIKGKKTKFTIITKDKNGDRCSGDNQVSIQLGGVNDTIQVKDNNDGNYVASLIPQQVGEVKLPVLIGGQHIKGSPYSITVKDYTSVNKPSKTVNNDGNIGKPWGIAFGKNGMWAVADYSKHSVRVFDGDDQLVRTLDGHGSNNSQFRYPAGVTFDCDGCLYVADSANHRIQSFTPLDGKHLLSFGSEGSGDAELKFPNGLTTYNGKVYVSDHGNRRISVFQTDGIFNCNFGSGQLGKPHDIAINDNRLLIADHDHHCIYRFTLDGKYVGKFGTKGNDVAQLDNPFGVSVDLYGFILVADTWNHRVSVYDKDGVFIHCFGSRGSENGQFQHPYGVAVSANGSIYVSDHSNKRIQIF